ncbi:hypothetical protein ALC57_06547 [Trachymyrmex cornetzi]|uniref:Uncharacterized protein n=1 Tax=Trachymyrmex cornetzi TaxID=471704 RepID=A0A151J8A7_9HYME|nr:hypothetical protein ALC57_06547 [Trachymyrmex cornetzi]
MEAGENVFVGEDAPTEEEEEVEHELDEHELDESLSIFNFTSCTNDELIEFMPDFLDLSDEEELLQFLIMYLAAAAAEADEEAEAAQIARGRLGRGDGCG